MIFFKNNIEKEIFILFVCIVISGIIGLLFIQSPDFDFYTYHYHSGWAFWNNRINIDFMPCQARSYYNPVLDAIDYVLIKKLNSLPYVYLFVDSIKYGLFLYLSYLIINFAFISKQTRKVGILSSLFLVFLSPVVLFSARMGFNDIQIADFVLISFYIFIKYLFRDFSKKKLCMLFLSTLILGIGIGLKYAIFIFVIPMVLSSLIYLKKDKYFVQIFITMFFGGLCGFMISGGWWMYTLWSRFKNPFFPYYNNLFKSPMADAGNYTQNEYAHLLPKSIMGYIFAPFKNTIVERFAGLETPYFEPKMFLSALCIIFLAIFGWFKSVREKLEQNVKFDILGIFFIYIVSVYYINAAIFGSLRYIMALTPMCSVLIVAISLLIAEKICKINYYPILLFVLIWTILSFYFETNIGFVKHKIYSVISMVQAEIPDDATVLCANQTACFVSPEQNKNVKYIAFTFPKKVRETHNLWFEEKFGYSNYYYQSQYIENRLKELFNTEKNIYIIFNPFGFKKDIKAYLAALSYYKNADVTSLNDCKPLYFNVLSDSNFYIMCKLK